MNSSVADAVPKPLVNDLEVHAGLDFDAGAGVRSEALRLQELAKGHAVILNAAHHLTLMVGGHRGIEVWYGMG